MFGCCGELFNEAELLGCRLLSVCHVEAGVSPRPKRIEARYTVKY